MEVLQIVSRYQEEVHLLATSICLLVAIHSDLRLKTLQGMSPLIDSRGLFQLDDTKG
jgi:hypothetical protein